MGKNITTLSFVVLALAACGSGGSSSGDVAADGTGDVSNPPVERRAFDAEVKAACGPGEMLSDAVLRQPYLQLVSDVSATVVWTTAAAGAQEVEVTTPDGIRVSRAAAIHDTVARPADGGRQLQATVPALAPSTLYCYQLLSDEGPLTERIGFRTAPAAGAGAPVDILVFGDSGDGGSDQYAVLDQMVKVPFDLILHVGDIAYDSGTRQEISDHVFDVYEDLLKHFPIFPATGNHEYGTEEAAPFREAFVLPENGGERGRERWYSFDWGDVHVVVLDTELVGETQARWLDADLAASDKPWEIVLFHRPPYSSGSHGPSMVVREHFTPILEKHQVPLVLVGHEHHYERFEPINGVTYLITGGGGRGTRPVGTSPETAFADGVLQFVQLRIAGDTLALHAVDATGREFDSLVLRRPGAVASRGAPSPR